MLEGEIFCGGESTTRWRQVLFRSPKIVGPTLFAPDFLNAGGKSLGDSLGYFQQLSDVNAVVRGRGERKRRTMCCGRSIHGARG
jgi:hypothetical protein